MELVTAAHSVQTRNNYNRVWEQYCNFCKTVDLNSSLPINPDNLLRFIAFQFQRGYASSSIQAAVSALNSFHKLYNFPEPTNEAVRRAILGFKNLRPPSQGSLPIPIEMLEDLLAQSNFVFPDSFTNCLFKAMTSLAYFALLRVGEFTFSQHNLKKEDVSLFQQSISVNFRSFKHSKGRSICQTVSARNTRSVCPVHNLRAYLILRGDKPGFLFIKENRRAPSRAEYLIWLQTVMIFCGYDITGYNTHSLRAGMATHMALQGSSGEQIKLAGRWASDAYKRYIRVNKV